MYALNVLFVSPVAPAASALKHKQVIGLITGADFLSYIATPPSIQNGLHE